MSGVKFLDRSRVERGSKNPNMIRRETKGRRTKECKKVANGKR